MPFPSLGVCCHFTSAMGSSYGVHLPLDAPVCISLGAPEADPYNLGSHTESWESHHHFTPACVQLSLEGHQLVHLQLV